MKNGKKDGENRECLNCRLTVDIFDRSGEEAVRKRREINKLMEQDGILDIAKERRTDERTCLFKE